MALSCTVRPKYLSLSIATAVFVRSSSNLKCRSRIWQRRVRSTASNSESIKRECASIYFRFGSILGLHPMEKIDVMSNISKTVTDTGMGSMKAEYETNPRLSIDTMAFDIGWRWTVLIQGQQNYRSNIPKIVTDTMLGSITGYRLAPWSLTLDDLKQS